MKRRRRGSRSSAARRGCRRSAAGSSRSCRSRGSPSGSRQAVGAGRDDPVVDGPAVVGDALDRRRPRAATIPAVERTSAPSPAPAIRLSPSASAASISARWLIDLSPGSRSSPRSRALPRTRAASARRSERGQRSMLAPARRRRRCPSAAPDERVAVERPDVLVDRDERGHQVAELVEVELLLGVGQRLVRVADGPRP